jgi:integron cassette Hfx-like protein
MERDTIAEVEIDADGKLHVVPSSHAFPYIYREAMEVHWDPVRRSLFSPALRDWSYSRWLQQILAAAHEQDCELEFWANTKWLNIDSGVKAELLQVPGNGA